MAGNATRGHRRRAVTTGGSAQRRVRVPDHGDHCPCVIALARPRWARTAGPFSQTLRGHDRAGSIAQHVDRGRGNLAVGSRQADGGKTARWPQRRERRSHRVCRHGLRAGSAEPGLPDHPRVHAEPGSGLHAAGRLRLPKLLEAALEGFGESHDRDRYLVVLSDGESSTRRGRNRPAELAKRDIHVVGIGVGTAKGGFINDQKGGYLADRNGDAIVTRLQPATLQTLANRTNGKYVNASELATPRPYAP